MKNRGIYGVECYSSKTNRLFQVIIKEMFINGLIAFNLLTFYVALRYNKSFPKNNIQLALMRFKITLQINHGKHGNLLPLSYQYELSSVIYKIMAKGDFAYSSWLHNNGFSVENKRFKLFVFSNLLFADAKPIHNTDRLAIFSDTATLYLSFLPERSTEEFIKGIFLEKEFSIGDKKSKVHFRVQSVELLPSPALKEEMVFQTLSPVVVSVKNDEGRISYLSPETEGYSRMLLNNLKEKYKAFYKKPFEGSEEFEFELLSEPKSKLITIKANTEEETKVRGFNYRFRLRADKEFIDIIINSGLGEKGSSGFGYCQTIDI